MTTTVTWTLLNVTLHVHCLSCYLMRLCNGSTCIADINKFKKSRILLNSLPCWHCVRRWHFGGLLYWQAQTFVLRGDERYSSWRYHRTWKSSYWSKVKKNVLKAFRCFVYFVLYPIDPVRIYDCYRCLDRMLFLSCHFGYYFDFFSIMNAKRSTGVISRKSSVIECLKFLLQM
jgi:hypothetical protein